MKINYLFFTIIFFLSNKSYTQQTQDWTIEDCITYATENNLTVQHNKFNEELVNQDKKMANNAWLPIISGNVDNNFTIGAYNPTIRQGYYQFSNSTGIQSNINIYRGGQVKLNKEKAEIDLQAAKTQTEVTINDISIQLTNYYLTILLNKELKKVAEANLEVSRLLLDQNNKRFKIGKVSQAVVAQSESEVAQTARDVVTAQIEIERSLLNLSILLQLNSYKDFNISSIKIPDELSSRLYNLDEVLAYAQNNQPVVKNGLLQMQSAEKSIEIAKTSLLPSITGSYNFGTNYIQYFNKELRQKAFAVQLGNNITNVFGLSLSVPIWNQYAYKINIQKAKINQNMVEVNYKQAKQDVYVNVQSAYFEETSSYASYTSMKEAYNYAKISYEFALKSYNAGTINLYDFNRSRTDALVAQSKMLQAKYNYIFKQKVLDFYAGIPITLESE
ncbi:TolC family protein [Chishuiella sp.]|uniref:TolC family protein n=1 Tax=Chishuiella sp. TaxID=1969467 RepID=UPI0028AD605D|nr:TolC family protein [Chishuiella sp.]